MLRSLDSVRRFFVYATDGEIGQVKSFYFDDEEWIIKYIVVDTGVWLPGRKLLIPAVSVTEIDFERQSLTLNLSREKIKNSPAADVEKALSRLVEDELNTFFGLLSMRFRHMSAVRPETHLRNTQHVIGHYIQAKNGHIGHVYDFVIDEETWTIRYMVVDTGNWFAGKRVLISPEWVESVNWHDQQVYIDLTVEQILTSPEYSSGSVDRGYEEELFHHYFRTGYWFRRLGDDDMKSRSDEDHPRSK